MLRYLTAGESHGKSLVGIIEGLPAGLSLNSDFIDKILKRRQGGYGRGKRMEIESDEVEFISGLRGMLTLGSPLTMMIANRDWNNWQAIMSPGDEADLSQRVVKRPRPGHADLPGALKYGYTDIRNVLERASARETAMRSAVGAVAQEYLRALEITIEGQVLAIGGVTAQSKDIIIGDRLYDSPVYCPDERAAEAMVKEIDKAKSKGDSLGGIVQVLVEGLPPGLGSHVHWDRRLDGRLAQALMSIPAIKGVEIGIGFGFAALPGSKVHDEIAYSQEVGFSRYTNNAGGLEGGITNGETLVIRAAMKPIPTLYTPLRSVDIETKEPLKAAVERSDTCAVPAAAIVAEAAVAWELAVAVSEKFGGDHISETGTNFRNYLDYLKKR